MVLIWCLGYVSLACNVVQSHPIYRWGNWGSETGYSLEALCHGVKCRKSSWLPLGTNFMLCSLLFLHVCGKRNGTELGPTVRTKHLCPINSFPLLNSLWPCGHLLPTFLCFPSDLGSNFILTDKISLVECHVYFSCSFSWKQMGEIYSSL